MSSVVPLLANWAPMVRPEVFGDLENRSGILIFPRLQQTYSLGLKFGDISPYSSLGFSQSCCKFFVRCPKMPGFSVRFKTHMRKEFKSSIGDQTQRFAKSVSSGKPALILLDINMQGIQLVVSIRQRDAFSAR